MKSLPLLEKVTALAVGSVLVQCHKVWLFSTNVVSVKCNERLGGGFELKTFPPELNLYVLHTLIEMMCCMEPWFVLGYTHTRLLTEHALKKMSAVPGVQYSHTAGEVGGGSPEYDHEMIFCKATHFLPLQ